MQVPSIKLSKLSQYAVKKIIKSSQNKIDIGQQINMVNYYTFLHTKHEADNLAHAKLLISK